MSDPELTDTERSARDAGFCCDAFRHACAFGTDAEQYGSAIYRLTDIGKWQIGSHRALAPIRFCPWCGKEVGDE